MTDHPAFTEFTVATEGARKRFHTLRTAADYAASTTNQAVQQYEAIHRDATRICLTLNAMDRPPPALLDLATELQADAEAALHDVRRLGGAS